MILFIAAAVAVIWVTNAWLTERFSETTRNRAEVRLALYTGNVMSELQRTSVVPLLLARDPALIVALERGDFSVTSQRLITAQGEVGAASIDLLEPDRAHGGGDRPHPAWPEPRAVTSLSSMHSGRATPYSPWPSARSGGFEFTYSRAVRLRTTVCWA